MIIDSLTTNRTNEIMTLVSDKIERSCAHSGSRWSKTPGHHIWDFDRIARLIYYRTHSSDGTFDHAISVRWKRPIGKGNKDPGILKGIMVEYDGSWYTPGDFGFFVGLWSPNKQALQESAPISRLSKRVHWRPVYEYGEDEVWGALEVLCKHYEWVLERGKDSKWMTLSCGSGSCSFASVTQGE